MHVNKTNILLWTINMKYEYEIIFAAQINNVQSNDFVLDNICA